MIFRSAEKLPWTEKARGEAEEGSAEGGQTKGL
jgi:hypothetical protein